MKGVVKIVSHNFAILRVLNNNDVLLCSVLALCYVCLHCDLTWMDGTLYHNRGDMNAIKCCCLTVFDRTWYLILNAKMNNWCIWRSTYNTYITKFWNGWVFDIKTNKRYNCYVARVSKYTPSISLDTFYHPILHSTKKTHIWILLDIAIFVTHAV